MVQLDPLLRDSQGQNQGTGRAVLFTIRFEGYVLPGCWQNLVLASVGLKCLFLCWLSPETCPQRPLSGHCMWASLPQSQQCYAESFSCWNFSLNIFCHFSLTLTRVSSLLGAQGSRLGSCGQSSSIVLITSAKQLLWYLQVLSGVLIFRGSFYLLRNTNTDTQSIPEKLSLDTFSGPYTGLLEKS